MNKKQILKNMKKNNKDSKISEERDNYFKFVTTLAILLIVFILAYFLIGLLYTKEIDLKKGKDKDTEEVNIDNGTIMLGQLFEQSKDEYYVIIYDLSDKVSSIPTWLSSYESKEGALTVYKVDSTKKFNSNYIVKKDGNSSATNLSELKVVSPTLIKVSNKAITEYIEGEDAIVSKLKEE